MSAQQYPNFLDDPKMHELLDIAKLMEMSLLQEMTEHGCKVTAFFQREDSQEILAECEGADMVTTTLDAIEKAIAYIDATEEE